MMGLWVFPVVSVLVMIFLQVADDVPSGRERRTAVRAAGVLVVFGYVALISVVDLLP